MEKLTKKEFKKLVSDNSDIELSDDLIDIFYFRYKNLDNNSQSIVQIMLQCSKENIERIFNLIEGGAVQYYEDYDVLMLSEGWSALSFICDTEISEDKFEAMYDQGILDDDKIYNCIAVNHTVFHPSDSYSEPYVVWFS